ncbi:MAG: hypothetical protein HYU51_01080 [Candidatus Rokubacteria bacterium]|nr:hypothetical protein [Candidatus Rokubacteria bacterium]
MSPLSVAFRYTTKLAGTVAPAAMLRPPPRSVTVGSRALTPPRSNVPASSVKPPGFVTAPPMALKTPPSCV